MVRLPVPPCPEAGDLVVEIETPGNRGAAAEHDPRLLGPGLVALMLCAVSDRAARLAYLEAMTGCRDAEPPSRGDPPFRAGSRGLGQERGP